MTWNILPTSFRLLPNARSMHPACARYDSVSKAVPLELRKGYICIATLHVEAHLLAVSFDSLTSDQRVLLVPIVCAINMTRTTCFAFEIEKGQSQLMGFPNKSISPTWHGVSSCRPAHITCYTCRDIMISALPMCILEDLLLRGQPWRVVSSGLQLAGFLVPAALTKRICSRMTGTYT